MDASTTSSAPPPRNDEPDSRNSLRHILADEPAMDDPKPSPSRANSLDPDDNDNDVDMDADASKDAAENDPSKPYYTATTTTTRRNANGSVSSVYSGNKIRHLKKDDGIPLWRKDIQYVFHKADGSGGHTFADVYLDAMAKSSKCSKILREKLLSERPAAINMAMVCLLVNVGRMNTTLNCEGNSSTPVGHL
jgi:Ino eighty subunit 1